MLALPVTMYNASFGSRYRQARKGWFLSFFRLVGYGFAGYLIIASCFLFFVVVFYVPSSAVSLLFLAFRQPQRVPFFILLSTVNSSMTFCSLVGECCFTFTVTVGFLGTGFFFVISLPFLFPRPVPPLLVRGFVCKIHFYNR